MKAKDQLSGLRRLTEKELSAKIVESKKRLVVKQQEKLLGKLKNTSELKVVKKDIARAKTILDEVVSTRVKEENSNE